jgi:hypothetical protein
MLGLKVISLFNVDFKANIPVSLGGAICPFIVGAIAQARVVKTLQPIILTLLAAIAGLWICLPKKEGKRS